MFRSILNIGPLVNEILKIECHSCFINMALDGETDIFKAKEILGDHMCIMGDVTASILYLDTPDIVYDYYTKLIRELGPGGFILKSGCDTPANAKLENVKAMISAALDSRGGIRDRGLKIFIYEFIIQALPLLCGQFHL